MKLTARNIAPSRRQAVAGLAAAAVAVGLGASPAAAQSSQQPISATYTVTFENATIGQWLTPPNFAAHDPNAVRVFRSGGIASPGVQAVAENGGVPVLAAELSGAVDDAGLGVSGVGADAPIGPGESTTFTFTTDERALSIVSMLICTNDGFAGLDSGSLPTGAGESIHLNLEGYDAGTEINTERRADLVPAPFCGDGGGSETSNPALAEGGTIALHPGIRGVGDLAPSFGWCGPVARITVTREG